MLREMAGKEWDDVSESQYKRSYTEIKNNSEGD